ncbi:hypothetical protein LAZ67_8001866 [Cordylochernes scorpioides]|uniref:Uncharacterized protein n=1 Tax=Cordylochernes scorpioides TaxID=51811 RepID=A0ABY6KQK4_9ARAC|nr:hypothetical protein LAZ67_8001866 [Cordylochernes scorpioides]
MDESIQSIMSSSFLSPLNHIRKLKDINLLKEAQADGKKLEPTQAMIIMAMIIMQFNFALTNVTEPCLWLYMVSVPHIRGGGAVTSSLKNLGSAGHADSTL